MKMTNWNADAYQDRKTYQESYLSVSSCCLPLGLSWPIVHCVLGLAESMAGNVSLLMFPNVVNFAVKSGNARVLLDKCSSLNASTEYYYLLSHI